jgi:cytochrome c oxidase subunit 2
MTKHRFAIAVIASVILAAPLGSARAAEAPTGLEVLDQKGCLACHTTDGTQKVGPTFKGLYGSKVSVVTGGQTREVTADEEYLRRSIQDPKADLVAGFPDIMPQIPLEPAELDAALAAIKALAAPKK